MDVRPGNSVMSRGESHGLLPILWLRHGAGSPLRFMAQCTLVTQQVDGYVTIGKDIEAVVADTRRCNVDNLFLALIGRHRYGCLGRHIALAVTARLGFGRQAWSICMNRNLILYLLLFRRTLSRCYIS